MSHERITLQDSIQSSMIKLADGNPGAISVMCELYKKTPEIDPDSALGGLGSLFSLDSDGIYGSRIWMLYKDCCGQDLVRMCAAFRAVQLGLTTREHVNQAIDSGEQLNFVDVVRAELPAFGANNSESAATAELAAQ